MKTKNKRSPKLRNLLREQNLRKKLRKIC